MTGEATDSTMHGPIAWMTRNPVAANLAMLVLLIGGLLTSRHIKKEVFPDFELDVVNIVVPYPGASPEEVERAIVLVVEENIRGLDGVKKTVSRSSEGMASISAELLEDADSRKVYQEIQQTIDRIKTFPEDAEKPIVTLVARRREVLSLILSGDVPEKVLREQGEILRDRFLLSDAITQVDLGGTRRYQITISVSREALAAYHLTLDEVARRIRALAVEIPGGGIRTKAGEILVRVTERRDYGPEFGNLPIITANDGTIVRLEDIADIRDGFDEDQEVFASWNGKPAILLRIYRVGDQTPLEVSGAARALMATFNEQLPPNLSLAILRDMSDVYRARLELLRKNGLIGLTLVMLVLGLFLEARLAFWVMMGIPISFLGGLVLLPYFGMSINLISMFAFLIALGIVVDDAIVVGENVYEHRQRGEGFIRAAITGTREVSVPVVFSVLTNIVAFLPLMFLPGFIGKIWFIIPVVVNFVFFISLMECLFILPAHLAHASPAEARFAPIRWMRAGQQRFSRFFMRVVCRTYGPFLNLCLRNRYIVMALGLAVLILTVGYVKSRRIGVVPMMSVESDFATVTAVLPYGSPVENTFAVRDALIAAAHRAADDYGGEKILRGVYAEIGKAYRGLAGGHVVEVRAYLVDADERDRLGISTTGFTQRWRRLTGPIVGLDTILFEADRGGPGSGAALSIQLSHSDGAILEEAARALADALAEFPIVSDIDDGISEGKPQLSYRLTPSGVALGLTAVEVARQVRNAFYGAEALRQQRGRDEVKVMVKYPRRERLSEYDLHELLIRTPAGVDVPLREVVKTERGRAYTSIEREDGQRTIRVTANVTPRSESENILADIMAKTIPELKERFPGLGQSFAGRQRDLREGMRSLMFGFLIAILAVYVLLAIPFRSYVQPLIIMACIPFGIVGAVIAHVAMGYPLSLMSMMGIVALSGVVVNDSLVLIDFANGERRRGASAREAVRTAGIRRFRPILLTTLTTFFGLAPMIFETSRQARFLIPMAISLGFGIVFSTIITLVLVPALYVIVEEIRLAGKALPCASGNTNDG